jgi:amino acid transporter
MSKQGVLPGFLSRISPARRTPSTAIVFTTLISLLLIGWVSLDPDSPIVVVLGGTTSLLLLTVFAVVNVTVLVLRRDKVDHKHFRAGVIIPVIGIITCLWLVLPFSSGRDPQQYQIAGALLALGVLLWILTWFTHGRKQAEKAPTGLVTEPTKVQRPPHDHRDV